ncbi:MAG TPA: hypothetical protein VGR67_08395 [Candidatus Polarisedimenticolia bacterium]|jgi:hypothetical protein|nr:hypothetical protein [Candidatus Polarisedimenticolia bacterium]
MGIFPPFPGARRAHRRTLFFALILLLPPAGSVPRAQERLEGSDFIFVEEQSWRIGEVRSYTLLFDRVPFGRETIRLLELQGDRAGRRLKFSQTLALDLRALGQRGFLTFFSTIRYAKGNVPESYRVEGVLQDRAGYSTYSRTADPARRTVLNLELAGTRRRMTWDAGGESREIPLPPTAGVMLVDPLSMVHWERLFVGNTWRVGDTRSIDVLLPAGSPRFDYHLEPFRPSPPVPRRVAASLTVEARETIEVFSVPISSFRCSIPDLGLRLWVSSNGGVLKVEDGRGLVILLER